MRDTLGESLKKMKRIRNRKNRILTVIMVLSLVVSLDVFWTLRQPGLTLAGDATCGIVEHTHDEVCSQGEAVCELEEHVHKIECYSDDIADVETSADWQAMFASYPYTGNLRQDLVGIANTQVGYTESALNFQIGEDGTRRGYTRYGAWYGAPYSDWSAMFVSFCLNYAGADQAQTPGNSGADSMAEQWKQLGKYAAAGEYVPVIGDLAFFTNHTVGIVTDVQSSTCYVIKGDVDGTVCGSSVSVADGSITGWGVLEEAPVEVETDTLSTANETLIDLKTYLGKNGGTSSIVLLTKDDREPDKDSEGHYIVKVDTDYNLTLSIESPNGIPAGKYQYQLPSGLEVTGHEGRFVLDEIEVGIWHVSDDGVITIEFNAEANRLSDMQLSATMGVQFKEQDEPIVLDVDIIVIVEKPPEKDESTQLNKWGMQGVEGNNAKGDPTKIYWTVEVKGRQDSQIPGSVITDQLTLGEHSYSASDMEAGIHFGASETNPETGQELGWHEWVVTPDNSDIIWDESGWSYTIPEKIVCIYCGEVTLGNNGWTYYIDYTTTPDPAKRTYDHMNHVTLDGQEADGWSGFEHGDVVANIVKDGSFHGDANGGKFLWEVQATIPGMKAGEKSEYYWYFMDYMDIRDNAENVLGYITNDADHSTVTATNLGTTVNVPQVQNASETDQFAWINPWSPDHNDGIYYGREIDLLCRCKCNAENCHYWNGTKCESIYWFYNEEGIGVNNGFCRCWTVEGDTIFTFSYETNAVEPVENYGGAGNLLRNEAVLHKQNVLPDGKTEYATIDGSKDSVSIPGVFKKELSPELDGCIANYKITVNEAKLALTNGTPLTIHDVMSDTLAFIRGSLVITAEDEEGNIQTLHQDVDYTVTYDGSGTATNANGESVHLLDIVILNPQPVTYLLDYDATLIIPEGATKGVKYNNSASITLWGKTIVDSGEEKVYADINIAAKRYRVDLAKTSSLTGDELPGAAFGLYNANDGLITSGVTDANGALQFETNITEGIILREHVLYYIQEEKAPKGYQLDKTKYWFCFCNDPGEGCETCDQIIGDMNAFRIPHDQIRTVYIENEPSDYNLPATGGMGGYPLAIGSIVLIVLSISCGYIRKRKKTI